MIVGYSILFILYHKTFNQLFFLGRNTCWTSIQITFESLNDPSAGEVRSYLISLKDQTVRIRAANKSLHFERDELIYTELSRKYTLDEIEAMGNATSLKVIGHVMDSNQYFSDSIFVK